MLPVSAQHEAVLSDRVAIYDVTHLMPKGKGAYKKRDPKDIVRVYVHKSGADGPQGFDGVLAMARYCTSSRGWPGAPYTFFVPRKPDKNELGQLVIYRCQKDHVRSFHTGMSSNGDGIAICLQGNYDGEWDLIEGIPKVERQPTPEQIACLNAFVDYLPKLYEIEPTARYTDGRYALSGHWEGAKPKAVCPGDFLRNWVMMRRSQRTPIMDPKPEDDPNLMALKAVLKPGEFKVDHPTVSELQAALKALGYAPGKIDGVWGYQSRTALEKFQSDCNLTVDGWYGPKTAMALLKAMRAKGIA